MTQGLRIAKTGYNANDAEEKNRVYDSNFNTFKYVSGKVINVTNGTVAQTYTVFHGLGYAPSFLIYIKCIVTAYSPEYSMWNPNYDSGGQSITVQSDKNNIYLNTQATATADYDIILLIGADDLNDIGS